MIVLGLAMNHILKSVLIFLAILLFIPQTSFAHSYPAKVGEKLSTGVANMVTGIAEIPKTMIVTGRREGATYGMTAGFFTGLVHMMGRTLTGALDVATFLVPTTPIVHSRYIWDDFNRETTYNAWKMR